MSELVKKMLIWRIRHVKEKHLILFLSIVIGILAALTAVILKTSVHYVEHFLRNTADIDKQNWFFLAFPLIGILITVFIINKFFKEDISHGVSKILQAISKKKSIIKRHNTYSSIITCTFTSGFGGSVGMEAPILYTGSAIGSNIGQLFHLNYKNLTLLIGCGVAGALSGIFKAPITGLIFVFEVLMLDLTTASIIPILISTVTGALVSTLLLGKQIEFYFTIKDPINYGNIPFYLLLGMASGFASLYFMKTNAYIEGLFKKIIKPYRKVWIGGLILGVLIFVFPPLYGEGYSTMMAMLTKNAHNLLDNSFFYSLGDQEYSFLFFLLLVILFKVIATATTTGSGGIGGIFAPSLFMGGIIGFAFARFMNVTFGLSISESNFALVGMAGMISGVMHAPLTAIFLIAEITGGYELFLPLIITALLSYLTNMYFEKYSIYTKRLALKGELLTHNKDKNVLAFINLQKIIETNFTSIEENKNLGDLVKIISLSKRNIFPVVDKDNVLKGLINLDNIRSIMFKQELYNTTTVKSMMETVHYVVTPIDSMDLVMDKFKESDSWNLPVVDNNGIYLGFVSKSTIFNSYRRLLKEFSEE